jgi:pilus assembly protein CpaE
MNVGASYYLNKPVTSEELYNAVRRAHEVTNIRRERFAQHSAAAAAAASPARKRNGKVIALFSPSGGMGRTTIAANIAVALARDGKRVALVDLSLPFGDVGVLLNAPPKHPSIGDLVGKFEQLVPEDVERIMYSHRSGLRVLLAPPRPETEENIEENDVRVMLNLVRSEYDIVIVDTWPTYAETMLAVFDCADTVLIPVTLELTATKNARVFIDVMRKLGLDDKVALAINRTDLTGGIKISDVEHGLGRKIVAALANDEHALRTAMNRGLPLVETHPESKLSKDLVQLAHTLVAEPAVKVA